MLVKNRRCQRHLVIMLVTDRTNSPRSVGQAISLKDEGTANPERIALYPSRLSRQLVIVLEATTTATLQVEVMLATAFRGNSIALIASD